MKIYEKVNQLKGTDVTIEQIAGWSYMNKICPLDFGDGLELDCEYPEELDEIAIECCHAHTCSMECLDAFLNTEVAI